MTAETMLGVARTVLPATLRSRALPRMASAAVALAAVAVSLLLAVAGLPVLFAQVRAVCTQPPCGWAQLSPDGVTGLARLGVPLDAWAAYWAGLNLVYVLGWCGVATLLAARRPDEPIALLGCVTLAAFGSTFSDAVEALRSVTNPFSGAIQIWSMLGSAALMPFFYLFPDGQFVPRWTRWLAGAWVAACAVAYLSPPGTVLNSNGPIFLPLTVALFLSVTAAQAYRYWRVSSALQRHQAKWVVAGFVAAFGSFYVDVGLVLPRINGADSGSALARAAAQTALPLTQLLIPLAVVIAILRYRLWDIDVLINRALVYGALSASIVVLYVGVVGYLGAVFHTSDSLGPSLAATGLVAVALQPVRQRLQQVVNHLLYGERDDPYTVLSRLGQRLESTLAPDAISPMIVQSVRDALKLPYAAIALEQNGETIVEAASGIAEGALVKLALVHQTEPVGHLLLSPRAPGETFSPADRRLLDDLARQAGIAVHAVRLTADLQRSRQQLVTAREEERRRLRRDLHDGLGTQLAAMSIQTSVLRNLIAHDGTGAGAAAAELQAELRAAIASIRRLVRDLRPPALDELGLIAALRARAAQYGQADMRIVVDAPDEFAPLPAAVEVAIYRIVEEALTNAVRHARAKSCEVKLTRAAGALHLAVKDDGIGLSDRDSGGGVGLISMRERATELGGTCQVASGPRGGTEVLVRLPLPGD